MNFQSLDFTSGFLEDHTDHYCRPHCTILPIIILHVLCIFISQSVDAHAFKLFTKGFVESVKWI